MKNRYAGTAGIPVFVSACLLFSVRGQPPCLLLHGVCSGQAGG